MFLFSSLTEAFTRPCATWPRHEIHIKAEEFCETPPTVRLCRPHPYSHANRYHRVWELVVCFVPQHRPGWNVGLICYQFLFVFPADAHRPGVTQPHSRTSCVRICQDCSLMLLTFGFVGLLQYAWQTLLVPKGLSLQVSCSTTRKRSIKWILKYWEELHCVRCQTGSSMWGLFHGLLVISGDSMSAS